MSGSSPDVGRQHEVTTSTAPVAAGVGTLDYATPPCGNSRQRLTTGQFASRCGLIACLLLAFSLAVFDRDELSWSGGGGAGGYRVHAGQLAIGFPLPWLTWNAVIVNGTPPTLSQLPEGNRFRPGFHISVPRLLLAIGQAIPLAILIQAVAARVRWRGRFLFGRYGLALLVLCAVGLGGSAELCAAQRTSAMPLIVALGTGLAIALTVAWPDRGYGSSVAAVGIVSACIWWGMSLSHLPAQPPVPGDMPPVALVLGWFVLYLLPVVIFVAMRRMLIALWDSKRTG